MENFASYAEDNFDFNNRHVGSSFNLECKSKLWQMKCENCSSKVSCVYKIGSDGTSFDMVWDVTEEQKIYCRSMRLFIILT